MDNQLPAGGNKNMWGWVIGVLLVLIIAGGWYYFSKNNKANNTNNSNLGVNSSVNYNGSTTDYSSDLQQYTNNSLGVSFRFPKTYVVTEDVAQSSGTDIPFFSIDMNSKDSTVAGQGMTISNKPTGFESDNILEKGTTSIDAKQVRWEITSRTVNSSALKTKRYLFSPLNNGKQYSEYWIAFPVNSDGKNQVFDTVIQSLKLFQ